MHRRCLALLTNCTHTFYPPCILFYGQIPIHFRVQVIVLQGVFWLQNYALHAAAPTSATLILQPIRDLQPPIQMPLGCQHVTHPTFIQPQPLPLTPQLSLPPITKPLNHLAGHSVQQRVIQRMTKVRHAVPLLGTTTKRHPVHRRLQHPIRPKRQQIANVHQYRRLRKRLRSRVHRHSRPAAVLLEDLEPRLTRQAEQQGDASVVRVRTGAYRGGAGCERAACGVVEQAEDGARGAARLVVAGGEVGGVRDV